MKINADKILQARKQKGFTRLTISNKLLVTSQTLYNWETGKCSPNAGHVYTLSKIYKKPITYFYNN